MWQAFQRRRGLALLVGASAWGMVGCRDEPVACALSLDVGQIPIRIVDAQGGRVLDSLATVTVSRESWTFSGSIVPDANGESVITKVLQYGGRWDAWAEAPGYERTSFRIDRPGLTGCRFQMSPIVVRLRRVSAMAAKPSRDAEPRDAEPLAVTYGAPPGDAVPRWEGAAQAPRR